MKEWIYIVTWCLVSQTPNFTLPARQTTTTDDFGRTIIEYHTPEPIINKDCEHSKTFTDRDSALIFYNSALNATNFYYYNSDINGEAVTNVKLDSLPSVSVTKRIRINHHKQEND